MFEFLAEHIISLKIKSWGVTLGLSNLENRRNSFIIDECVFQSSDQQQI